MTIEQQTSMEERWPTGTGATYSILDTLHDQKTDFQQLQVHQTEQFGRMLVLDGFVQTTEKDEFIYHEMMAHVPLFAHPCPQRVLIIGGGDGGILREVLRHPQVQQATMVEIDDAVIDFTKQNLPMICQDAFDDPRGRIVIDDGAKFVAQTDEKFDVIIVDSPDPVGPAEVLFTQDFYRNLAGCLAPGGIVTRQTGSTFMQPDELPQQVCLARDLFDHVSAYTFAVPTYIGGLFSAMFASNGPVPSDLDYQSLFERFDAITGEFGYYNPGLHLGAFHLPGYVQKRLDALQGLAETPSSSPAGPTFGWELQLDLYECDPRQISTEKEIQDYARQLCDVIEMKAYGDPLTPYFGENHEHTKGYSLLQFIETSSITGHFSEGTGGAFLNVFSCMPFDAKKAKQFSQEFFGAKYCVARFCRRANYYEGTKS